MLTKNRLILQKIDKYCNGLWQPNKKEEFKFLSNNILKKITGHNKSMNTGKLSEWYVGEILRKKNIHYKCQPIIRYNLNKIIQKNDIAIKQKITRTGPMTRSKTFLLQKKNTQLTKQKDSVNYILTRSRVAQSSAQTASDVIFKQTNSSSINIKSPEKRNKIEPVLYKPQRSIDIDTSVVKSNRFIQPDYYLPDYDLFIEVKSRSYNCNGTASEKLDHIVRKYSKLEFTNDYKKSKLLIVCSAYELFEESTSELLNYNNKTSRKYIKDFVQLSKKYNILDWIPINKIHNYL